MAEEDVPARKATDHLYWARTSSQGAAPPPKPISAEEAQKMEQSSKGSAWNKSGNTWEEKPINAWAHELLTERLGALTFQPPSAKLPKPPEDVGGATVSATCSAQKVESVKGDVTYVVSRGKQRVVFELTLKVKLEVEVRAGDELKTIVSGKLMLNEVSNDDLDEDTMPDSCKYTCDDAQWKSFFEKAVKAGGWAPIKAELQGLVDSAKQKYA